MNAGLRFTALFFAVLIFFLSVRSGAGLFFADLTFEQTAEGGDSSVFLKADHSLPLCVTDKEKEAFGLLNQLKGKRLSFKLSFVPVFLKMNGARRPAPQSWKASFLSLIIRGLETREIIFPFHSFW